MNDAESTTLATLLEQGGPTTVTTAYGDDPDQVYETFGDAGAPVIVLIHGGYFRPGTDRTHARPAARALAESGWQVVLAEYRRVPGDPQATVSDVRALDAHLTDRGIAVVGWVGHSAGGTIALLRALLPGLAPVRVVGLAAVVDLTAAQADGSDLGAIGAWVGTTPTDDVDPATLIDTAPEDARQQLLLLHGDADDVVPPAQVLGLDAPHVLLRGAHHFDVVDPGSPTWGMVAHHVATHVGTFTADR